MQEATHKVRIELGLRLLNRDGKPSAMTNEQVIQALQAVLRNWEGEVPLTEYFTAADEEAQTSAYLISAEAI